MASSLAPAACLRSFLLADSFARCSGVSTFFDFGEACLCRTRLVPRIDAGDILADEIDVVQFVIASIHECRERPPAAIISQAVCDGSSEEQIRDVFESEVVGDSNDTARLCTPVEAMREDGDAESVVVNNSKGSPMHLFVRQYEKMQFDRDSEESYQEKRTKLGGVVLAQNLPIEIYASQIYTRAMFEKFGEMLYECGSYVLTEVVARCEYIAVHVKKASRDKWSKNQFLVRVSEPVDEFNCECGMFQHFGMVCSHALKVMVHLGLQEVPAKHVLKRWTKDARDILPQEFLRYQKDQGPLKYSSRRHNNLHLLCLEIVRLGDSNVDSYDIAMEHLRNVKTLLEPVAAIRDGMGLSDREGAGDSTCSGTVQQQHFGAAHQEFANGRRGVDLVRRSGDGGLDDVVPDEIIKDDALVDAVPDMVVEAQESYGDFDPTV
ncbi:Protein FAR1-RELATED SEQUENCE 5 [Hordeum vulgare]|nr:Protein FAR1-RELATED SEQUENCE 5 [Hordeum vulgare]